MLCQDHHGAVQHDKVASTLITSSSTGFMRGAPTSSTLRHAAALIPAV